MTGFKADEATAAARDAHEKERVTEEIADTLEQIFKPSFAGPQSTTVRKLAGTLVEQAQTGLKELGMNSSPQNTAMVLAYAVAAYEGFIVTQAPLSNALVEHKRSTMRLLSDTALMLARTLEEQATARFNARKG